ncbi:NACHT domain-containing protein [Pedobacter alluvionis]|uniref:Nephrocystin 3-like N-terminal domain-containing protein n=1 Tax=Pedobacter alluvionis TaxID=475253 RepID=A0A497Y092_9SPHI|nr:ATP-binding protein [Pedobacter alluvionis]RLJ75129.1 hypothetical protein BCL90_3478 [Pedobacter alluvionis]TFB30233.1 hypothetical protein E3V97_18870 [Pedobacter alluvionis]
MSIQKTPGEVAAIASYFFQYGIFATEIYNHLLQNDLQWIEFASNGAGKLDDVLLGTDTKVIAYQIKEIGSSNFSYTQFTQSDTDSIFQGVFKGWQSIKTKYLGKEIDARFVTTQQVSEGDSITAFDGRPKPSFAKFIANFWQPIQKGAYNENSIPKVWQPVFDELVAFANTTDKELIEFIKDFKFVFNYKADQFLYDTYTQTRRKAHIERIEMRIPQVIAQKGNVKFDRSQFLVEFGLKDQFETRFQHAFFVDDRHYLPLTSTFDQLNSVVQNKNNGYLALVGNAGSGKSTLLTKWLSNSPYKVLKYYAYTNLDMSYDFGYRGEAKYFLHDLLVQIREGGLNLQDRLPEKELSDLQKHLAEELKKLSYRGEKVFIIVDGLDHIEREQHVGDSLISVLPAPSAIPDNIYFILGSRTVNQLSDLTYEIREDLKNTNSTITIDPLSKEQLKEMTDSYKLILSVGQVESLYHNTKGHPLFLRYTIEELNQRNAEAYDEIIGSKDFSGDIYREYSKFWEKYKVNDQFVHILGIIARFRFPYFDLELLGHFKINGADADRVNKTAEYYFYKSENIWQFFHNSFKEFLIEESARNRFSGKFDKRTDQKFHLEIANAIKDIDDQYRFNIIYHWYKAEQYTTISDLSTQSFFRQQWFLYRNSSIIREDIRLALLAGEQKKNYRTVAACFFALLELEQRTANLSFGNYYDIFLSAGLLDTACSFVFDSAKLLVPHTAALDFSNLLFDKGYKDLSLELFNRATPIYLFEASAKLSSRRHDQRTYTEVNEVELLETWANVASIFLPLDEIIEKCRGIVIGAEGEQEPEEPLLPRLILSLKDHFIIRKEFDKLKALADHAKVDLDKFYQFDFYFDVIYKRQTTEVLRKQALDFFENWQNDGDDWHTRAYALIYTFEKDDASKRKEAFNLMVTPTELKKKNSYVRAGGFANYIFNYARLFYIITKDFTVEPEIFLPPSDKPTERAFDLAFAEMARANAWFFHGYAEASTGFFGSVDKLFSIFHHRFNEPLYDHEINAAKGKFVEQILAVSLEISDEVSASLLKKLTNEWNVNGSYWSNEAIQGIIEWSIDHHVDVKWCKDTLLGIEKGIYSNGYLTQRISEGVQQARLWSKLKETPRVESTIDKLMSICLGMSGEDDQQVGQMVNWIEKYQPTPIPDIQYYLDRLASMKDKVNSSNHTPAIAILELSFYHGNGYKIFEHLLFKELVNLLDGFEYLLIYLLNKGWVPKNVLVRLFTRIIVAFDDAHSIRRLFIRAFFRTKPDIGEVEELIKELHIFSLVEIRNSYLLEIYEQMIQQGSAPARVGLSDKPKVKDEDRSSSEHLRLKDSTYLSHADVLNKVTSLDDLLALKGEEERNGYFNWTEAFIKVIPTADTAEIKVFLNEFNIDIDTKHITKIAGVLSENGKTEIAKELLKRTIEESRYCQWGDEYYAKGKILAYTLLEKLTPCGRVPSDALKDFVEALPNMGTRVRESVIADLDKVFTLFDKTVDLNLIYEELNLYRDQLLSNEEVVQGVEVQGHESDDALFIDFLTFLVTTPSQFTEIIYPVLIAEYNQLDRIIPELLKRLYDGGFTLKFLKLLHGVANKTDRYVERFKNELEALVNSSRFDLMLLASDLLNLGGYAAQRTQQISELPLSYTLELPPERGIVDASKNAIGNISDDGYLKETNDPLVYTKIIDIEISMLARVTGFAKYNIAYRIRVLGDDQQFPIWCSNLTEQELRGLYESMLDLKVPYNRPQVQKVYVGLAKVLMELLELGYLDFDTAEDFLPHFDPATYLVEVVSQPRSIASILKKSGSAPSVDRKWAHEFDDAYISKVLTAYDGERFILAERTLMQGMGHGKAIEIREAFIEVKATVDEDEAAIFRSRTRALIRDYIDHEQAGIIIYNSARTTQPKENWLAVNPLLAMDMGLNFNEREGNFRWDNEAGEAVIESVFWQLGDSGNKGGHHDSESGNGWQVLITREGLEAVIRKLGSRPLFHYKRIQRHLEFHQRRYNTYINEEDMKFLTEEFNLSDYT